ncbi:MAG: isocitrate lyase/phosphoenolpyruvate mutase family protein, partial [Pseudomonadota bacterium]
RAERFHTLGADILFVEAPRSVEEMRQVCADLPGPKMANIVEGGETPDLSHAELGALGYAIAAYPLTLMAAAMRAMMAALAALESDTPRQPLLMEFTELRQRIGFDAYYETSAAYESARRQRG